MKYVYTVITRGKDELVEGVSEGAQSVCFSDAPQTTNRFLNRLIHPVFSDARRDSRTPKILPHIFLPDAKVSLYLDGNISLRVPLQRLVDEWLQDADVAMFKHDRRSDVYQEGAECVKLGLDRADAVNAQLLRYQDAGFPRGSGLWHLGVLLRRHTPEVKRACDMWFAEYVVGSRRDQISFPYALAQCKVKVHSVEGNPSRHPYFQFRPHKISRSQERFI